ncbi:hypothetical protein MJO28_017553 [Puccinia striiformis f. sp. tritici]|nr:hypothetical protein MJO28_017553 [Puccinia striiformis f. sp. tritici]
MYNFVYLSPEIFLNSSLWDQVYFSANFQDRLALVVVDEAHIIHQWGLVESGGSKHKVALLGRLQDIGIFWPSYGKLGGRLLTRNNKPILLMSATCRPEAITAIKKSLKLEDHNLEVVQGELTRPEIRIIRVPMENSMASCADLLELFGQKTEVPDESVVPTLIYSRTRNQTKVVMKTLDLARGTKGNSARPRSSFVRRFHSCTGTKDKIKQVQDFANKERDSDGTCRPFSNMSNDWPRRTRRATGVGYSLRQKKRIGGKNSVDEFDLSAKQSISDRMDALAVTPVCLRIAFALDNALGYIPLAFDDPCYIQEEEREKKAGFAECLCSNCEPEMAAGLIRNIKRMTVENIDEMLFKKDWPAPPVEDSIGIKRKMSDGRDSTGGKRIKLGLPMQEVLSGILTAEFSVLFRQRYPSGSLFTASQLFGKPEIDEIIKQLETMDTTSSLRKVIGGETILGQVELLHRLIGEFVAGPLFDDNKLQKEAAQEVRLAKKRKIDDDKAQERAVAKAQKDEIKRQEREQKDIREAMEKQKKSEQTKELAMLIRLAGEEVERRGVQSIHRGRYQSETDK